MFIPALVWIHHVNEGLGKHFRLGGGEVVLILNPKAAPETWQIMYI